MRPKPFVPKNGHTLAVLLVARISGSATQKGESLDDQSDHGRQTVAEEYEGQVEYTTIQTTGKGEKTDRPELAEIEAHLRSGKFDLMVVEDLGRLVRGGEAHRLLGIGVDAGTHTIAINDCIDTRDTTWESDALEASGEHVGHNVHTSRRLKKKMMNRFRNTGGVPALPIAGYIIPAGAKKYPDWQKDDSSTAFIQEGARRLLASLNCSAVADWFNSAGFATGPYCRLKVWYGAMVRRFYGNPILKGMPYRGAKHTIKHHENGHRVSQWNPEGPTFYEVPSLAHLSEPEFDALDLALSRNNANRGRRPVDGIDPLLGVPRKRTRFPGQHACCWYCGRQYLWGGNGIRDTMMCKGAREWRCWNGVHIKGLLIAERLGNAIRDELLKLEGFETQFSEMVDAASAEIASGGADAWNRLLADEQKLSRQMRNLVDALADYGPEESVQKRLEELKARQVELAFRRNRLEQSAARPHVLPASVAMLRESLLDQLAKLTADSYEFGDLMRQLVPEFRVHLVRLCDGGRLLPRAKVKLNLGGTFEDVGRVPSLDALLTRELTIDLFDPPQREQIRLEAVRLAEGKTFQRDMVDLIPGRPTQPAISKAILLDRQMKSLNLVTPYETVLEPPEDYTKLRRQDHKRYRFEPLDGYQPPPL